MSVILGVGRLICKAAKGKDLTPYKAHASDLLDRRGNNDGTSNLEDVGAIVENIGDEIGDVISGIGEFLGNLL